MVTNIIYKIIYILYIIYKKRLELFDTCERGNWHSGPWGAPHPQVKAVSKQRGTSPLRCAGQTGVWACLREIPPLDEC